MRRTGDRGTQGRRRLQLDAGRGVPQEEVFRRLRAKWAKSSLAPRRSRILDAVYSYIARDSPVIAEAFVERLREATLHAARHVE